MSLAPWPCEIFPAIRGDKISEADFIHYVENRTISCTAVSKNFWDVLLAVTPTGLILDVRDIDHQLSTSVGRIGCALSHIGVLNRFLENGRREEGEKKGEKEAKEKEEEEKGRKDDRARHNWIGRGKLRPAMRGSTHVKRKILKVDAENDPNQTSHQNLQRNRTRYLLVLEDDAQIWNPFTFRRDLVTDLRHLYDIGVQFDAIDLLHRSISSHMPNNLFFMRTPHVTPHLIR